MKAIELEHISKVYKGGKRTSVFALQDFSLEIDQGEVFGFLGPNGAGKSTTIKILMGLIRPNSGRAKLFGAPVTDASARKRVGYLPENPAFYEYLNAVEYLRFVGKAQGLSSREAVRRGDEVLELMDLKEAARRPLRSYSKGMIQRLGLAQTLVHDPDLYVFDEPMSGLDPIGRALVKEIIQGLRARGKSVFFSTHITADVEAVCDRVGVIFKGRLNRLEKVEAILSEGIEGYVVHVQKEKGGELVTETNHVSSDDLASFLQKMSAENATIRLIEPKRKNLEDFFLDIAGEGH